MQHRRLWFHSQSAVGRCRVRGVGRNRLISATVSLVNAGAVLRTLGSDVAVLGAGTGLCQHGQDATCVVVS